MPPQSIQADVLIAGGGIAGLTSALLLAKQGFTIALFEQAAEFSEIGAGLQLSPNATRILRGLDFLPQLKAHALEPDTLIVRAGSSAQVLTRLPLKARAKFWGAPYYIIHRADLLSVLLARAKTMPNIRLYTGQRLIRAEQTRRDVTFEFAAGDNDVSHGQTSLTATGKIGLGADGLRSALASVMFGQAHTAPLFSGKITYRTTIPASHAPTFAQSPDVTLWLSAKAHGVHYPLSHADETYGLINLVVIIDGTAQNLQENWHDWDNVATTKTLAKRLANFAPEYHDLMQRAKTWRCWPLYRRPPLPHYHDGRFALLGDAAHPMLPHLAQGASQAIEDAHCLAMSLNEESNPAQALLAYNKARYQRTQAVMRAAHQQGAIYHLSGAAALARNLALRLGNPKTLLARYDWIYGYREQE